MGSKSLKLPPVTKVVMLCAAGWCGDWAGVWVYMSHKNAMVDWEWWQPIGKSINQLGRGCFNGSYVCIVHFFVGLSIYIYIYIYIYWLLICLAQTSVNHVWGKQRWCFQELVKWDPQLLKVVNFSRVMMYAVFVVPWLKEGLVNVPFWGYLISLSKSLSMICWRLYPHSWVMSN